MHLENTAPPPSGYFLRSSPDGPERGPLSLDNLRDLAEFQHVTPESWIREPDEAEPQCLADLPELMAAIFPQKKSFQFKHYNQTRDTEAGYAPVDVKSLFRCDNTPPPAPVRKRGAPPPPSVATVGLAKRGRPAPSIGFDPKSVLEASQAMIHNQTGGPSAKQRRPRAGFSAGRTFFAVRWTLAALLLGCAIWVWSGVTVVQDIFLLMVLGMIPMVGAILLTVSDIINWAMNQVGSREIEPPDFNTAETAFAAEDWPTAAAAYLRLLQHHPHELRAYVPGIAAGVAAGELKKVMAFHNLANKHLGAHDRNLLVDALARRGLPQLPTSRKRR
jgi:hypothetical protein